MTFPFDPLDVHVEMRISNGILEDESGVPILTEYGEAIELEGLFLNIDSRLLAQTLSITAGRSDETSHVGPATVSFQLDNRDGQLTPDDPRSGFWPLVNLGCQVRLLVDTDVVFWGEASAIAPTWPVGDLSSMTDPGEAWVQVTASGILRRLGQGQKPLHSALWRQVHLPANAVRVSNYWPLEDQATVASGAASIGIGPMVTRGFSFSSDSTEPGSEALPKCSSGFCDWNAGAQGPSGSWTVEQFFLIDKPPVAGQNVVWSVLSDGTPSFWHIEYFFDSVSGQPQMSILAFDAGATLLVNTLLTNPNIFGGWKGMRLNVRDQGGIVQWSVRWYDATQAGSEFGTSGPVAGNAGAVNHVGGHSDNVPGGGFSLGHVIIHDQISSGWISQGAQGWVSEPAGVRMQRLAIEEAVSLSVLGDPLDTIPMGAQHALTLLDLLQEAADADGGILCELRTTGLGLEYRTRVDRYNAPIVLTLDAAVAGLSNNFAPLRDDQQYRNDINLQRNGGSQYRAIDPLAIGAVGKYDVQVSMSLADDTLIADAAEWLLHMGDWPGYTPDGLPRDGAMRTPQITLDLALAPGFIATWKTMKVGDRIRIINLPPQFPRVLPDPSAPLGAVDLIIEGWTEALDLFAWTVTFNCSPAGPWTVAITEDAVYGRADTDYSRLTAAINTTQTSFQVDTVTGPVWIDTTGFPTEFPFDMRCGGEVMTVSNITPTSSPQTFTVTRSVNGIVKAHGIGTAVALAYPAVLAR